MSAVLFKQFPVCSKIYIGRALKLRADAVWAGKKGITISTFDSSTTNTVGEALMVVF